MEIASWSNARLAAKEGKSAGERDESFKRQSSRHAEKILLGDAQLNEARGELIPEQAGLGGGAQIGVQHPDTRVSSTEIHQGAPECFADLEDGRLLDSPP